MNELFLKIVNMSISASWLILAVLILRLVLKKAPRWVNVLLWGIVAVRLICPFSIESALSLIPSAETIPMTIEMDATPAIDSGINAINSVVNPVIAGSFAPYPGASANPLQIWIPLACVLWTAGMIVLLLYTAISYGRLHRRVDTAVWYRDNIFQSENVSSPFVLGIIRPRIYLPFKLEGQNLEHVVAHELSHIRRKDHWWKPLGFLLLTLHWFNPLMWLGYVLLCRDIEIACDEKVIRKLGDDQRADYTQALVSCSINRRTIAACPLAFGEVGVKDRVKSVMNYKKPAFWVIVMAVALCAAAAVCFLTNPIESTINDSEVNNVESDSDEKARTWQSAYLEIICHLQDYLVPIYEPDGTNSRSYDNPTDLQIYLGLHDFDNDDTLELVVGDLWTLAVFTYKDGQAEKIADLYYPNIVWCINGVHFKDNSISLNCDGAGGSDFVNFGYLDGEYMLGLYSELNTDSGITINGVESTLEEMNRIYTLDWEERSEDERKERMRLMWENETWILKYLSGEEVILDSNFDFNSILW